MIKSSYLDVVELCPLDADDIDVLADEEPPVAVADEAVEFNLALDDSFRSLEVVRAATAAILALVS